MMYRKHQEYRTPGKNPDHELLRSWLRGEAGVESLKTWLQNMYG